MPRVVLRGRQPEWIEKVEADLATGFTRMLFCASGGAGKTVIFGHLAREYWERHGIRSLITVNRKSIVRQTARRIAGESGIECSIEMGDEHASPYSPCVVASVQSLSKINRLTGFSPDHFGFVFPDEAHLTTVSEGAARILNYFHFGAESLDENWTLPPDGFYTPKAKVIGFTATPEDKLLEWYQHVTVKYPYFLAVKDGVLVPVIQKSIPVKIDLSRRKVGNTEHGRDFKESDLTETLVPVIEEIADQVCEHASDRKSICFLPSVDTSIMLSDALVRRGMDSVFVSGHCEDGEEKTDHFRKPGKGKVLCNAQIYCLDSKTEILTSVGFVGMDDMTDSHLVANWREDGSVFFAPPKGIATRALYDHEHMVSVDSRTINFRVTNTHTMVVRNCTGGTKKIMAKDLTTRYAMPTSGIADPILSKTEQPNNPFSKRRVVVNAWMLRNRDGYEYGASCEEATRRENKRCSLRYTDPCDLSVDDCRFIGMWVADGTVCTVDGNPRYSICQSYAYPAIMKWISDLIERMGLDAFEIDSPRTGIYARHAPNHRWNFSLGTGGGTQEREGVFRLTPYLKKEGTKLLWSLNERQFDAVLEGYWYGDGRHGAGDSGFPRSLWLQDTKKTWIDLLCSIGSVRGWRCNMKLRKSKNIRHKDQWYLRMIKGMDAHLSDLTKINHEPHSNETVWCVETDSGNIVTRRMGKTLVMGNSFGIDFPDVNCVGWFRATISKSFFLQGCFRGSRVLPGVIDGIEDADARRAAIAASAKPNFLLLDPLFVTDRTDLCDAYDLFCENEGVKEKMKESGILTPEAAEKAERDFVKSLNKAARRVKHREARIIDPLSWGVSLGIERLKDYQPETDAEAKPVTPEQLAFLAKQHISAEGIKCRGAASLVIGTFLKRVSLKLATPEQLNFLKSLGMEVSPTLSKADATRAISARLGR